jgi:hypothetical protein
MSEVLVIDGTINGKFKCTVRKNSRSKELQGALCKILIESETNQVVLGRIGMIDTTNIIHENPAFKPLVMEQGKIDYFSKEADVETTIVEPIACIDEETKNLSKRRANPSSGTSIAIIKAGDIEIFKNEKDYFMNIGYQPGYSEIVLSVQNKHSGDVKKGGWGEARHRGYFGQTGSGKTVFALQSLAGRAISHRPVGFLIPDTKGDIARDSYSRGEYEFSFFELLRRGERAYQIIGVEELKLESTFLFRSLISKKMVEIFNSTEDKVNQLINFVISDLVGNKAKIDFSKISLEKVLNSCRKYLDLIWASGVELKEKNLTHYLENLGLLDWWWNNKVKPYFEGKYTISQIARDVLENGKFIVLDLKEEEKIQTEIMSRLFKEIAIRSKIIYKQGKQVNTEVFIDEAPRWVPQSRGTEYSGTIKDAVNTTRAYGLSWTFISQRITDIDKGIFAQCSTKWFGRNLGVGGDRNHLRQEIGEIGLSLYDELGLAQGYFFVGIGAELNLGSGGFPIAIMGWDGNVTQKIIEQNPHIWRKDSWI